MQHKIIYIEQKTSSIKIVKNLYIITKKQLTTTYNTTKNIHAAK